VFGRLSAIFNKPPAIVLFRAQQEMRLAAMRCRRGWERLEQSVDLWWTQERLQQFATSCPKPALIAGDASDALGEAASRGLLDATDLGDYGLRMRNRSFSVLGAKVPESGDMPWHSDWRHDYTWPATYFRNYNFYRKERDGHHDVKIPWELSRLWFVLPLLQAAAIDGNEAWASAALEPIADWERKNPLAHSICWCPMEASMRGLYLVMALDMLRTPAAGHAENLAPVLRLIVKHGEFIERTVEYSDVRGNHYAANVVALLLIGLALRGFYPAADRWVNYARRHIPGEIEAQFLSDGMNFEKSIAYHRLVTELFLVAVMALEKHGFSVPASAKSRLRAACAYSAAYTRPDGLTPNVGDNDNARVLIFDPVDARDHRPLLGLAAAYWHDPYFMAVSGRLPAAVPWLLGNAGLEAWEKMVPRPPEKSRHFAAGGAVTVREGKSFLWVDVGEVGLAGRGGHGHNDLLSFELVLGGRTLIVDPGNSVYTGQPELRDLFRSTAYHNSLRVDETEIATMGGMWKISAEARPCRVAVASEGARIIIRAGHTGYLRLKDPTLHVREDCWVLRWNEAAQAEVVAGWVSPGYGVKDSASIIVLTDQISGSAELDFTIEASWGSSV